MRAVLLVAGVLMVVVAPFTAILPVPAAPFLLAGGLALILRNSHWARRRWARLMRRWPRFAAFLYRAMRRPSVRRRRDRDRPGASITVAEPIRPPGSN